MLINMGGNSWCFLISAISTIIIIMPGTRAEDGGSNNGTDMFPMCNGSVICTPGFCMSVNITEEFNAGLSRAIQDTTNVLCARNTQVLQGMSATYRLAGCPPGDYFSPTLGTSGICFVDMQNSRDLYLTASKMVAGLHSFTCFNSSSPQRFLDSYVIVVNDTALFRDIQIYIDGGEPQEITNVNITEGEELTIVARAVGNVSFIEFNATSPAYGVNTTERFQRHCVTSFICNERFNGLSRFQRCSFRAGLNDNSTTINFFILHMGTSTELGKVNITVNALPITSTTTSITPGPTPSPSEKAESDDSPTTIIVAVVIPLLFVILTIAIIIVILIVIKRRNNTQNQSTSLSLDLKQKESTDYKTPVGNPCNIQLKVLVYCCDDYPMDYLISKLEQKDNFVIEKLADDQSCQLIDYISKLTFELNHTAVLLDCSCPGEYHSSLHKAVKHFTLMPFASSESRSWKVFQLVHHDGEIQSLSWSQLFDHVDVMYYSELDDNVVTAVVTELEKCFPSRRTSASSSINSSRSGTHLINEERKREQELQEIVTSGFKRIEEKIEESTVKLSDQMAKEYQETQEGIGELNDGVNLVLNQHSPMMHDIRQLVNESDENK